MTRRRTVSASLLAALAALALAATARPSSLAAQQQPDGGPVPRELALALTTPFGGPWEGENAQELLVGRAPAGLPAGVVPTGGGATVLGSLTQRWIGGARARSTTVVVATPEAPDSALAAYTRALESAGWRRAPDPMAERGGFVSVPRRWPTTLCRDSSFVMATAAPRGDSAGGAGAKGGSRLHIALVTGERGSPCDARIRTESIRTNDDPPFPPLRAPAGAETRGMGSNSSSSTGDDGARSREIQTLLTTPMSVGSLAAHYAAQLRAAGWTVREVTANGDVAVQVVEMRDSAGRPWRGLLTAFAAPGAAERAVALHIARSSNK